MSDSSNSKHLQSAGANHWTLRPTDPLKSLMKRVIRLRGKDKKKHLMEAFVQHNRHLIGKREACLLAEYSSVTPTAQSGKPV